MVCLDLVIGPSGTPVYIFGSESQKSLCLFQVNVTAKNRGSYFSWNKQQERNKNNLKVRKDKVIYSLCFRNSIRKGGGYQAVRT